MVHDVITKTPRGSILKKSFKDLDYILPFQIEPFYLRGRFVTLTNAATTILKRHDYPDVVSRLLAEMLILAPCLSSTLKYDGVFTLQISGGNPIKTLVADVTSNGALRAYAGFDETSLSKADNNYGLCQLTRGGYMAFTVDQKKKADRYQGIVELSKNTLAESILDYFRTSEQLETVVNLGVEKSSSGNWKGSAIIIQKEGLTGGRQLPKHLDKDSYEEAWRNAAIMLTSCNKTELLNNTTTPTQLLYQLFHETGVRIYPKKFLRDQCRCSVKKVERILLSLDNNEINDLKVNGEVHVTCEFCKTTLSYDEQALAKLLKSNQDA